VLDKLFQQSKEYKSLPAKVAQQTLKLLDKSWKGYFAALKEYKNHPEKFKAKPKPPGYKAKDGRAAVIFTEQSTSKKVYRKTGQIKLTQIDYCFNTNVAQSTYCQSRIVPKLDHYLLEVVYEVKDIELKKSGYIAAIDIGINNLGAISSNKPGFQPVLVNGRPLKSINQYFNKKRASLQSVSKLQTSNRLKHLTTRRNHKVRDYLHKASRTIIDLLVEENITKLVIGNNPLWKQEVELGKRNNQNFTQIPHSQFIEMLTYKGRLKGIEVIVREESYTSKSSFLDNDSIPNYGDDISQWKPSGRRVKRGLYKTKSGRCLNSDINGSYNILVKEFPKAFVQRDREALVCPRVINVTLKPKVKV
jgi:putative transposase